MYIYIYIYIFFFCASPGTLQGGLSGWATQVWRLQRVGNWCRALWLSKNILIQLQASIEGIGLKGGGVCRMTNQYGRFASVVQGVWPVWTAQTPCVCAQYWPNMDGFNMGVLGGRINMDDSPLFCKVRYLANMDGADSLLLCTQI